MAQDLEQLVLSISADTRQIQRALKRLEADTGQATKRIERQFSQLGSRLNTTMVAAARKISRGFIGMLAGGLTAKGIQELSDAATRIDNALKVAGLSGKELEKVYSKLRDSAMKNAVPLESMVTLYGRIAQAQDALHVSQDEMVKFTDKIGVALRVSGSSATEASGALLQLSQALGSGIVRAEEYNSINEGARPILQAVAAGLKEAGGDVAKLRNLVMDGKVSSEAFFRAFEAGAPILEEKVASATFTMSQAAGNLGNALVDVAREFNTSTGASERFAGGINSAAQAIADFDVSGFIRKIQEAGGALHTFLNDLANSSYMESFAEWITGTQITVGKPVAIETLQAGKDLADLDRQIKILEDRIAANKEMAIDTSEAETQLNGLIAKANALRFAMANGGVVDEQSTANAINRMVPFNPLPAPTLTPKTVSLDDFDPPGGNKKKNKRAKSTPKTADDRFAESVQAIRDRTTALKAEQEMLGSTFYEQQRREVALDLEQEALKQVREEARKKGARDWQNAQLSPDQVRAIDEVSEAYARQADELRKAQEAMDLQRDVLKGVFSDFRSALEDGKLDWEDFGNIVLSVLDKIINKIEDDLIDAIFAANNTSGSGSLLGSIFSGIGSLFGGGSSGADPWAGLRLAGGGTVRGPGGPTGDKIPAMLSDGEHVTRAAMAKKYAPLLEAINADRLPHFVDGGFVTPQVVMPQVPKLTARSGGGTTVNASYSPTYNVTGSGAEIDRLRSEMARDRQQFKGRVIEAVADARRRNIDA